VCALIDFRIIPQDPVVGSRFGQSCFSSQVIQSQTLFLLHWTETESYKQDQRKSGPMLAILVDRSLSQCESSARLTFLILSAREFALTQAVKLTLFVVTECLISESQFRAL
jgi:hypothetical protein